MGVAGSFDRPGRLDGVAGASSTGLTCALDLRRERLRGVVVTALLSSFSADDGSATGASSFVAARNSSRVSVIYGTTVFSQSSVGGNFKGSYTIAAAEFAKALDGLKQAAQAITALESTLEAQGAPWTPGRIPTWSSD